MAPGYDGMWFDEVSAMPSTMDLSPGKGFWVRSQHTALQTIYLDGLVSRTEIPVSIDVDAAVTVVHQLGQPLAADVPLTEAATDLWEPDGSKGKGSPDGCASDQIWLWDQAGDEYQKNWLYDSLTGSPYDGTWFDAEQGLPTMDILGRGQGWWYMSAPSLDKAAAGSWLWAEPVPY